MKLAIDGISIGLGFPPFVIAEMSGNHNGSIEQAKGLIRVAKASGASAVKLQTYKPDTLTIDCDKPDFFIDGGLWAGKTLYELYEWAHTPWEWHEQLFDEAFRQGITIFSSPFDKTAVDLLEDLNCPAYKIASFEATDLPLIRYAASTGKPMIISTGMANEVEIAEAVQSAREAGCDELAILHCVSGYPAPADDYNLRTIHDMQRRFECVVGLSDHTLGTATSVASIAMGAAIIEKHFTVDRNGGGPDDEFSLEPPELKGLCDDVRTAWYALGEVNYRRKTSEGANLTFRRSLYFVRDVKEGSEITVDDIKSIRPGYGIAPKFLDDVIGKRVNVDVVRGTAVEWGLLLGDEVHSR